MSGFDVELVRESFPVFAAQSPLHYLDSAATAQMHESAFTAMRHHDMSARSNVLRGNHRLAELATLAYQSARERVAAFLNVVDPDEIIFTAGTTSAINLVAIAMGKLMDEGAQIVVPLSEHHSNFLPWQALADQGAELVVTPLLEDGGMDIQAILDAIGPRCRMVALAHASNVTGSICDLVPVVEAAHDVGARVLVDGAQMVPHGRVDVQNIGCDFYTFSGHKCFGPTGIGVLWGKREALEALPPVYLGGGMVETVSVEQSTWALPPRRFEAGTPPITQAVGLAAALDWLADIDPVAIRNHEDAMLRQLLDGLQTIPGIRLLGSQSTMSRLPVVSFVMNGCHPHDVCQIADTHNVALRGGHHCAEPLMQFFGVDASVRASLAMYNNHEDVSTLLEALQDARQLLL